MPVVITAASPAERCPAPANHFGERDSVESTPGSASVLVSIMIKIGS